MKTNAKGVVFIYMLAAVALVLTSCGGGGSQGYGSSGSTTTTAASTVQLVTCPASGTSNVSIVSMIAGFSPAGMTVPVNTTVKWTNIDSVTHTVTSTTVPTNGTFDSQVNPGASVCYKFTSAGTFNYHCTVHPTMPAAALTVQ